MNNKEQLTHFAKYEFVRIIVPGLYFIFLMILFSEVFEIYLFPFSETQLLYPLLFIGGIVSGLTLYALESSKKRKAFQTNQPSLYIIERSRIITPNFPLTETEAQRLYYYILNNSVPPILHEKIFTFGILFHVLSNIRRITLWFAVIASFFLAYTLSENNLFFIFTTKGFFTSLLYIIYFTNLRFNKADRKMQENYHDQIIWLQMNHNILDDAINTFNNSKSSE